MLARVAVGLSLKVRVKVVLFLQVGVKVGLSLTDKSEGWVVT